MQVFKFGGASINSIERIKKVIEISNNERVDPTLIVISAMGKTTNALEKVVSAFFDGRQDEALALFGQVKQQHLNVAKYLLVKQHHPFIAAFTEICTEAEWLLYDKPVQNFDYYYDQIVCLGELFSSTLLHHAFLEYGLKSIWIDVRDVLKTDDNFREAEINWGLTQQQTSHIIAPWLEERNLVITQGFIGSTDENESTTLGREGSDYTAAVFANLLGADKVTIWKDVDAVLNADPRLFPEAVPLAHLNYDEVVEMAFYGAQVIHPKTMKPLYNKNIPLQVKSFLNPVLPGTIINANKVKALPPVIISKANQVLMTFHSKDFSFTGEKLIGIWYELLAQLHLRPNLIQHGAVQFMAVFDENEDKIAQLAGLAEMYFDVTLQKGLHLFTIRHYTAAAIEKYIGNREWLLKQQTTSTIQLVLRVP